MKITDPDIIKNGEKDLIDAVKEDLDLDVIKQILEKRITAAAMSSKGGQIIVHNNEIAFKLDFDLNLSGSLMFDRQGNYIPEAGDETDLEEMDTEADMLDQEPGDKDTDIEDLDNEEFDLDAPLEKTPDEFDEDEAEPDDISLDDLPDDLSDETNDDLEINLPEYDLDSDEQISTDALEPLENEASEDDIIQDDMVHEDINDILKESQEFWDKKKDQ